MPVTVWSIAFSCCVAFPWIWSTSRIFSPIAFWVVFAFCDCSMPQKHHDGLMDFDLILPGCPQKEWSNGLEVLTFMVLHSQVENSFPSECLGIENVAFKPTDIPRFCTGPSPKCSTFIPFLPGYETISGKLFTFSCEGARCFPLCLAHALL